MFRPGEIWSLSVLGIDCCEGFLEYGRRDAEAARITNIYLEADLQRYPCKPVHVDAQVFVVKDLDDAIGFPLAIGPAGEVYREAGKLAEQRHDEIAKYQRPEGVMMDSSSWKVTA